MFGWGYPREHLPRCSHTCRAITHRSTFSFAKSKIAAMTMAPLLRISYKLTSRPEFTNGGSRVQSSEKIRIDIGATCEVGCRSPLPDPSTDKSTHDIPQANLYKRQGCLYILRRIPSYTQKSTGSSLLWRGFLCSCS